MFYLQLFYEDFVCKRLVCTSMSLREEEVFMISLATVGPAPTIGLSQSCSGNV